MADFKDFIPAGEDSGAYGEGGFVDFIPAPEPKAVEDLVVEIPTDTVAEVEMEAPVEEPVFPTDDQVVGPQYVDDATEEETVEEETQVEETTEEQPTEEVNEEIVEENEEEVSA